MKLINPSFEILDTNGYDIDSIYKDIERAARVCYKSEDRITEDSAKKMVDSLIKRGHTSCLEHGTIYLKVPVGDIDSGKFDDYRYLNDCPWVKYNLKRDFWYFTTNLRYILEHNLLSHLEYLCEPTEYHEKRYSVRFICDRGVSHELVRHRTMSFAQESQRYCNYSKDKFNNEVTFIMPSWCDMQEGDYGKKGFNKVMNRGNIDGTFCLFVESLRIAEDNYLNLLKEGWIPQQARGVLTNATKTEVVVTGFASDWKHLFQLRSRIAATGKPHPDMQALIDPLMDKFIIKGYTESLV